VQQGQTSAAEVDLHRLLLLVLLLEARQTRCAACSAAKHVTWAMVEGLCRRNA
jgi:hypothetical protein